MGTSAVIPPPPDGFSIQPQSAQISNAPGGSVPPPPPGFTIQANPQEAQQPEGFVSSAIAQTPIPLISQAIQHPIDTINSIPQAIGDETTRVLSNLRKVVTGEKVNPNGKDANFSNRLDAALSSVPLLGAAYQKMIQQEDDKNISGALGTATGAISTLLAPEAMKSIGRAKTATLNGVKNIAADAVESAYDSPARAAADRQQIPLTTGRQAETGPVAMAERVIRRSGSEAEKAALQQADTDTANAIIDRIQSIGDDIVKQPVGSSSKARAISDLVNSAADRAGQNYADTMDHINGLTGGNDAPLIENSNTLETIRQLEKKFRPSDSLATVSPERGRLLTELSDARTMFDPSVRTELNQSELPTKNDVVNAIRDTFRRLPEDTNDLIGARKVLRQAMKQDLEQSLPPYLRQEHNQAITDYAKTMDAVDSGIGRSIINSSDPDLIAQHFAKPQFGDIPQSQLETLIGKQNLPLVHGALVEHLIRESIPYDSGTFDGYTFARNLDKVNPKLLKTLPPDQLQALKEFAEDVKRINLRDETRPQDTMTGGGQSPERNILGITSHGIGKLFLGLQSAVDIGAKPLARLILNPRYSRLIGKALRTSPTSRGAIPLTQRLMFLVHKEELRDRNLNQ